MEPMRRTRVEAAATANAEDASIWRWLGALLEERRIRWRYTFNTWVVNVDCAHVATAVTFDDAIRAAKAEAEHRGLGNPGAYPCKSGRRSSDRSKGGLK